MTGLFIQNRVIPIMGPIMTDIFKGFAMFVGTIMLLILISILIPGIL